MIYYGNARNIVSDIPALNFTSYIEGYERLKLLPPNSLGASSEYEFDQLYAGWIMNNDETFLELFGLISFCVNGGSVYIIVSDDDWSETIVESLFKLIQQRYGLNATRVNCFEDYLMSNEDFVQQGFEVFNLDQDNWRYNSLVRER